MVWKCNTELKSIHSCARPLGTSIYLSPKGRGGGGGGKAEKFHMVTGETEGNQSSPTESKERASK